jgi:dimethylglycine dehydrogenase
LLCHTRDGWHNRCRCGSEPILANGCIVGRSTNGGYGRRVGKSLALAMVEPRFSVPGQELDIVILGKSYRAVVIAEKSIRSDNTRLKG